MTGSPTRSLKFLSGSTSVNGPAVHRRRHPPPVPLLHLRRLPPSRSLSRLQEVLLLRRMRLLFPLCPSLVLLIAPGIARPLRLPLHEPPATKAYHPAAVAAPSSVAPLRAPLPNHCWYPRVGVLRAHFIRAWSCCSCPPPPPPAALLPSLPFVPVFHGIVQFGAWLCSVCSGQECRSHVRG